MRRLRICLCWITLGVIAIVYFRAAPMLAENDFAIPARVEPDLGITAKVDSILSDSAGVDRDVDVPAKVKNELPDFLPTAPSTAQPSGLAIAPPALPLRRPFLINLVPRFYTQREHFHWGSALRESFEFATVMHLERLTNIDTLPDSGRGNVFVNYIRSVESLHGWDDHDRFVVQYLQHSFQGASDSRIELQNNPNGRSIEWGEPGYWHSRLVAMAWNGFWGAQFKIGPYSEAMIGNVGLPNKYRKKPIPPGADYGKMAWSEFVVNPVFGTTWVIAEDLLDHYVARRLEYRGNNYLTYTVRSILTPSRCWANLLRFRPPWYRQSRNMGDFPR